MKVTASSGRPLLLMAPNKTSFIAIGVPGLDARPGRRRNAERPCLPFLHQARIQKRLALRSHAVHWRHAAGHLPVPGGRDAGLPDGKPGAARSCPPAGRVLAALRRAGYLLGLAFLFRLQLWLFAWPSAPGPICFRVDVLNAMGFAIAVLSLLAVFRTAEPGENLRDPRSAHRVRLAAGVAVSIGRPFPAR